MKIKLLTNPLSKGESWEKQDQREIEMSVTTDNRGGAAPNVYFGIFKDKKNGKGQVIVEDIFLSADDACKIGNELMALGNSIIAAQALKREKVKKKAPKKQVKKKK